MLVLAKLSFFLVLRNTVLLLSYARLLWGNFIHLIKGHQPAGTKAGVKGQAQGASQVAKGTLARALGMPAAPQA